MPDLLGEIRNIFLFLKAVLEVLVFTGAGFGWLVAWGYEVTQKRRA